MWEGGGWGGGLFKAGYLFNFSSLSEPTGLALILGWALNQIRYFSPFAPGNFAKKRVLKLVEQFSSHCLSIKSFLS